VDTPCVRSRVRTRTHGSVGRRGFGPSDPINPVLRGPVCVIVTGRGLESRPIGWRSARPVSGAA